MWPLVLAWGGALLAAPPQDDFFNKVRQVLGSAAIAQQEENLDKLEDKIQQMQDLLKAWTDQIQQTRKNISQKTNQGPTDDDVQENIPFYVNITHKPDKCTLETQHGSKISVHYVGKIYSTKKIFASSFHTGSLPKTLTIGAGDVNKGLDEGLLQMCEGERRTIDIPWSLAEGKDVPPKKNVQYFVELVSISRNGKSKNAASDSVEAKRLKGKKKKKKQKKDEV